MNGRMKKVLAIVLMLVMITGTAVRAAADVVPLGLDMKIHGVPPKEELWTEHSTRQPDEPVLEYEDESIHAALYIDHVWASGIGKTECHWVVVEIKDPSQIRTTLSFESYDDMKPAKSEEMFRYVNAVCAINDDYVKMSNYKGYVMRQGVFYCDTLDEFEEIKRQDVLIIDDQGDFSTVLRATSAAMQEHLAEMEKQGRKPVNIFTFGPTLVIDGVAQELKWENSIHSVHVPCARAAIAQVGPLKYMLVAIDGEASEKTGMKAFEVSNFILSKFPDCKIAYNLDGGGSSKLHVRNKLVNHARGRREIGGLIYFASAASGEGTQE